MSEEHPVRVREWGGEFRNMAEGWEEEKKGERSEDAMDKTAKNGEGLK